jgi:hypothetical protein
MVWIQPKKPDLRSGKRIAGMMVFRQVCGQHVRESTTDSRVCQQICKRSGHKQVYNNLVMRSLENSGLVLQILISSTGTFENLNGCGGFMFKRILFVTVLVLTITGCTIDLKSLRGSPATAPTATQIPALPTQTPDLLPLPSLQPSEEIEPTDAARATPTEILAATATLDVTDMQIDIAPEAGALATPVYIVQPGTPAKLANFLQPAAGCNWTGVAGQVFNTDDRPVTGLIVEVGGKLEGSDILRLTLSGGSQTLGPGGFEIPLADHVIASQQELYIQLFDLDGNPLSDQFFFDTYPNCEQNLLLINFVAVVGEYSHYQYFPVINTPK